MQEGWRRHGDGILRAAIVLMVIAAIVWLGYEFGRLLFDLGPNGAVDLNMRLEEVQAWFRGDPVYGEVRTAVYPPASYAILWPLTGWLGITQARWLYAFTAAAALAALVSLVVRASGARSRTERIFVGLIPLCIYATGATIGNGQIIVYVIPFLVAALMFLFRHPSGLTRDLLGSLLVVAALVKPSVAAPFLWIVLFVPGRLGPALLTACGYSGITVLAIQFQEGDLVSLIQGFQQGTEQMLSSATALKYSHANVQSWLAPCGLVEWIPAASLALFAGLGVWTWAHRGCDVWLLAGVAALVARFWTFHGWYDDLLLVLPLISLFRLAGSGGSGKPADSPAGLLFAVTLLTLVAPGGLYLLPRPWNQVYVVAQTVVWVAVLVLLLVRARAQRPIRAAF